MRKLSLSHFFKPVFGPPFKGLGVVVWIYFVFCFLIQPQSQILNGNLPDPDDYLYLVQSIDLLHGQNWFDLVQHRMNPPEGTPIHFSHILCLFYAEFIHVLTPLLGEIGAATAVAAVVPLIYLAFFLAVIRWVTKPFIEESWAGVAVYVSLFAVLLIFQFSPGEVDHHGLEAMLGVVAFGAAVRMIENPDAMRWPALAGFMLSLAMVIGLESLPFQLAIAGYLGAWTVLKGGKAPRAGLIFALVMSLTSFGFLLLTKAPDHLLENDVLAYSVVYVILTAGISACFVAVWLANLSPWAVLRYAAAGLCAAATGYEFFKHYPALIGGPYGGMDPALASLMFDNIGEARPLINSERPWIYEALGLLWPAMAITANLCFLWKNRKTSRWSWGLLAALLISLTGLGAFYQIRIMVCAQAFCIVALSVLLERGWAWANEKYAGCSACAAKVCIVLLVGPLPMVLLPALIDGRPFNNGVLLFPNQSTATEACDEHTVADMLSLPMYYGDRPRVIMNTINDGPELLFRTPHKVLAGPFHENVGGNIDSAKFFRTRDSHEAETIARQHGVELVVICKNFAEMYLPPASDKTEIGISGDVVHHNPSFAQQLSQGTVPDWLKQDFFPLLGKMMLFHVLPKPEK